MKNEALSHHIQREIAAANGAISFARFMELALYTPGLGYYMSSLPKFGQHGDFITAPLLSPYFAKCIARQAAQILRAIPDGDILELGAGSGLFARDCLIELEQLNALPRHYYILEKSDSLREEQKKILKNECGHLFKHIRWLDALPKHPKIKGLIFANEVLDAQPVHCFEIEDNGFSERGVAFDQQFFWKNIPPTTPELTRRVNLIQLECPLTPGYQSEINLNLYEWIPEIAHALEQGVILFCDYGYGRREYYHPDRSMGTLMCFHQHRATSDPFQWIGLQDITAHVDFTAVIESAIDANLRLGGFTTQSSFLLSAGLLELATASTNAAQYQQNQAIKQLTLPSEMGELIKVMALTKQFNEPLLGFSLHDRRRSL